MRSFRRVHLKQSDGRSANWGEAYQHRPIPAEVIGPRTGPRIEQRDDVSRGGLDGREVAAFVEITLGAREAEVLEIGSATVLRGDNVVDVESQRVVCLGNLAVLTPASSASMDSSTQCKADSHQPSCLSISRALDFRSARTLATVT